MCQFVLYSRLSWIFSKCFYFHLFAPYQLCLTKFTRTSPLPSFFLSLDLNFMQNGRPIPHTRAQKKNFLHTRTQIMVNRSPCPDYREYSTRRLREPRRRGCVYTLESRPLYRSSLRIYNFVMDAANALTTSSAKGSSPNSLLEIPFQQEFDAIDSFAHS